MVTHDRSGYLLTDVLLRIFVVSRNILWDYLPLPRWLRGRDFSFPWFRSSKLGSSANEKCPTVAGHWVGLWRRERDYWHDPKGGGIKSQSNAGTSCHSFFIYSISLKQAWLICKWKMPRCCRALGWVLADREGLFASLMITWTPEVKIKSFAALVFIFFQAPESKLSGLSRKQKVPPRRDMIWFIQRRERDSNPRYPFGVYTLSRRAP